MSESPEIKISKVLDGLSAGLEKLLEAEAGERMGFALRVFPFERNGMMNFSSNCSRSDLEAMLEQFLEYSKNRQMPFVKGHEVH